MVRLPLLSRTLWEQSQAMPVGRCASLIEINFLSDYPPFYYYNMFMSLKDLNLRGTGWGRKVERWFRTFNARSFPSSP